MKNSLIFIFLCMILIIAGCGTEEVINTTVATIEFEPASADLLTGTSTTFIATARDDHGNIVPLYGNILVSSITMSEEATIAVTENNRTLDDKRYAEIVAQHTGTGEVYCTYGSVTGRSSIVILLGTIEAIHVAADQTMPLQNTDAEDYVTFVATGEDEGENMLYITPTWEALDDFLTLDSSEKNWAKYKISHIGFGTVEAYFGGKKGSIEVWVEGIITADASSYVDQANPSTNYSSSDNLYATFYPGTASTKETYVKFDLSKIPAGTTITSAYLTLTISSKIPSETIDVSITCHKVNASWTEGGINWNNKPAYNSTAIDSEPVTKDTSFITYNITSTAQNWIDNPASNYGIAIVKKTQGNQGEVEFEKTILNESKRPKINITY